MIQRLPIVGVMGASQQAWEDYAVPLGRWLAGQPVHLLTGGGNGVMTSVSKAYVETTPRYGLSIGCLPTEEQPDGTFFKRAGYPNPYVEVPIVTPLPINGDGIRINRNHVNILTSDIIIALPGSVGTLNESELAVQFNKPIVLYGPADYFTAFPPGIARFTQLAQVTDWCKTTLLNFPSKN